MLFNNETVVSLRAKGSLTPLSTRQSRRVVILLAGNSQVKRFSMTDDLSWSRTLGVKSVMRCLLKFVANSCCLYIKVELSHELDSVLFWTSVIVDIEDLRHNLTQLQIWFYTSLCNIKWRGQWYWYQCTSKCDSQWLSDFSDTRWFHWCITKKHNKKFILIEKSLNLFLTCY